MALIVLVCAALAAVAYFVVFRSPEQNVRTSTPPPPAPVEVGIVTVEPREVPFPVEYAGRVTAFRDVEIRALVGGILLKREFEEGARVTQNQVLFRIDPATYEVARTRAEAQLQQAQAALRQAEENYERIQELSRRGVSTERQLEEATSQRDQGRANVQLAQAAIEAARLNLGYTVINAPISGVTALRSPPVGTLILAQQTVLTTITQLDPAYVSFSYTDEEGQAFRELNERRAHRISKADLTVELHLGNGRIYPHPGAVDMAAQRIDPMTGTIEARATFPNPDGAILPGQFVRVLIKGITLPDAVVIPSQAISQGPQGPSVYVVGENEVAQARPIRLGPELPEGRIVEEGLKRGDRVVVDGVIRVRPGAPVRPVPLRSEQGATGAATAGQPTGARP